MFGFGKKETPEEKEAREKKESEEYVKVLNARIKVYEDMERKWISSTVERIKHDINKSDKAGSNYMRTTSINVTVDYHNYSDSVHEVLTAVERLGWDLVCVHHEERKYEKSETVYTFKRSMIKDIIE